eukprot:gnl/TRDRNA2_/TRDRNA2_147265_c0_seq3.p2 gnl/TRDRNA2_/TRDRNA2_147265_c0~~gnl/TRDRNA2_/TRDRNA2_147265_c0_seq3.p2  ORF type:complete len:148 (-),score=18.82 gnl/TRDRNA2_/TRDRNA2_147265_c0_seq3:77-520(-)
MVCAALGARVVLTDADEVLPFLEHRVSMNFGAADGIGLPRALGLRWGTEEAQALLNSVGQLDFVLCSDCVCEPVYGKSWEPLARCISGLCGCATIVMISVERRGALDGVDHFVKALSCSLDVELLCDKNVSGASIEVFVARRRRKLI